MPSATQEVGSSDMDALCGQAESHAELKGSSGKKPAASRSLMQALEEVRKRKVITDLLDLNSHSAA